MFTLSALILSLSLIMGTPAQAPMPAPVDAVQAPVATTCEEDMPCWDCAVMGNMECGTHPLEVEAWEAIDQAGITAPATSDTYMLSYMGSWSQVTGILPLGWFAIHSTTSDTVHYFQWELTTKV